MTPCGGAPGGRDGAAGPLQVRCGLGPSGTLYSGASPAPRPVPASMICQNCHKNQATVTVLELQSSSPEGTKSYQEEQLCEICAQSKNLPHAPLQKKSLGDIWKLLQSSGAQVPKQNELVCPDFVETYGKFGRCVRRRVSQGRHNHE